ncbi:MAG TPA: hypothetical protein PKY53_05530 [Clostridia bacterium]|nr:hypothetical protein [Clostridia bacterium]
MKKALLATLATVFLVLVLAGCAKSHDLSRRGHDDITEAGIGRYIAAEEGKYYLFDINKRKTFSDGYDGLRFIDNSDTGALLAYNTGDAGYTVISNKGKTLIESKEGFAITGASYVADTGEEYKRYGIIVEFVNAKGQESSALFGNDGNAVLLSDSGQVEVATAKDGENIAYVFFEAYDKDGVVIKQQAVNKNLVTVYDIDFDKATVFSAVRRFHSGMGYVAYTKKELSPSGDVISQKVCYDIYCRDTVYAEYDSANGLYAGEESMALFARKGDKNFLFNESGIVKEFDLTATVENNNVRVNTRNNLYDIYRYDGTLLLSGVAIVSGGYSRQSGNSVTLYNYEGKELVTYDTTQETRLETKRFASSGHAGEVVRFADAQSTRIYRFFLDGALVKEYGAEYEFVSETNGVYQFRTTKDGAYDNVYYFNAYAGKEFKMKATQTGDASATFLRVLDYKYYLEKNSNDINFYENVVKTVTPYNERLVPGYAREGGYYSISHQSIPGLRQVVLKIEFDVYKYKRVNDLDVYTDTNERRYAYYLVTDTGKAADLQLIYIGLSRMEISYDEDSGLICFSTGDRFAYPSLYSSFSGLDYKTLVFEVTTSGDAITLTKRGETGRSNMQIYNGNYLIGTDHLNGERNFVYTTEGRKVLDAQYYVNAIEGTLAIVNFAGPNQIGSCGVYDLEKGKLIESCDKFGITLLGGGYYAVRELTEEASMITIKNKKGVVVKNVISLEYVSETEISGKKHVYYKINSGKNKYRLLEIIA